MSTALRERVDPRLLPSSSAPLTGLQIGSAVYLLLDGRVAWIPINPVAHVHSGARHRLTASMFPSISHRTRNPEQQED